MNNTEPIAERITLNLVQTLAALDGTGDLPITLNVKRIGDIPSGYTPGDGDLVVIPADPELLNQSDGDSQAFTEKPLQWRQPFGLLYTVRESINSGVPFDRRLWIGVAAIAGELKKDNSRGGHARRTILRVPEFYFDNRPPAAIVNIDVDYTTLPHDLTRQETYA